MQSERDEHVDLRREFLWRFGKYSLNAADLDWAKTHERGLARMSLEPASSILRYVWDDLRRNATVLARELPQLASLGELTQTFQ